MAVMTASQKTDSKGQEVIAKKHPKYHHKSRPITATLEHPLILDIKLLKKLDMTTFTKKGLIALSKFCGISLINKTDTKKKLNKCVKTIQYSKKQSGVDLNPIESSRNCRPKRKLGKSKPKIRFKLVKEETSPDEDSLDVVCKKHNGERKLLINNILGDTVDNVIPEPCKTCSRSEHPERFHSHPKSIMKLSRDNKNEGSRHLGKNVEGGGNEEGKKTPCANQEKQIKSEERKTTCSKTSTKSPTKSNSSAELSSPETTNNIKSKNRRKPQTLPSSSNGKSKNEILKKSNSKIEMSQSEDTKPSSAGGDGVGSGKEEDMKYITGCYICGKQVSPKLRQKHEKSCISEWRTQNSLISPDKRKPEPKRPDYRFTATGELDCEGTFESIWANHMDSLVPCKKCGRKFFPDRIERHEKCCNNLPLNIKYKH